LNRPSRTDDRGAAARCARLGGAAGRGARCRAGWTSHASATRDPNGRVHLVGSLDCLGAFELQGDALSISSDITSTVNGDTVWVSGITYKAVS
jgi:hypothetical protein